jgi:hypothetical protein
MASSLKLPGMPEVKLAREGGRGRREGEEGGWVREGGKWWWGIPYPAVSTMTQGREPDTVVSHFIFFGGKEVQLCGRSTTQKNTAHPPGGVHEEGADEADGREGVAVPHGKQNVLCLAGGDLGDCVCVCVCACVCV